MSTPSTGARGDARKREASHDAQIKADALRKAAAEFATGGWADAFAEYGVVDDVSAVRATEKWFNDRADQIARQSVEGGDPDA